ncbi:MAG: WD40 repeat domain-containing serine/threonine protein kinase [Phycisphaerae bacterium]
MRKIRPDAPRRALAGTACWRRIGEGGMGVVYKAEQENPKRIVALKILRRLAGESSLRRFASEAQLLGELQHPGIAKVFEAAIHDDGVERLPYFAMELVPAARTLVDYARVQRLAVSDCLQLFAGVCDAVQHGHQRGVIHRDIKPDNILVDEAGWSKIIDFGVARVLGKQNATANATRTGHIIGTLAYMSPEQLTGNSSDIDTRADVYALGVVLYEMLADTLPLDIRDKSIAEACRMIREAEPAPLGTLRPHLRGDIELIVAKATEKDRERRYASAGELAADIRRFLNDEPILARPVTFFYQLQKFTHRNKGVVLGTAMAVLSLMLGLAAAMHSAYSATRARDNAFDESYRSSIAAAASALDKHDVALARRSLALAPSSRREWEWNHLFQRLDDSLYSISVPPIQPNVEPFFTMMDGRECIQLATASGLQSWDLKTGDINPLPATPRVLIATDAAGVSTAQLIGGVLRIDRKEEAIEIGLAQKGYSIEDVSRLCISNGGDYVVLMLPQLAVRVDSNQRKIESIELNNLGTGVDAAAVSATGDVVLASAMMGRPAIWSAQNVLLPLENAVGVARSVAISPEGTRIAVGFHDTTVGIWTLQDRNCLGYARGHEHAVTGVAFSPDGAEISSVGLDRTIRIWNARTLEPLAVLHGHERAIWSVRYSVDGSRLATASEDNTIRIWDATTNGGPDVLSGHQGFVSALAFSADGKMLASAGWDQSIRLWDLTTRAQRRVVPVEAKVVTAVSFSTDQRFLAWVGDHHLCAMDLKTGAHIAPIFPAAEAVTIKSLDFFRDEPCVALPWTFRQEGVDVWNVATNSVSTISPARLSTKHVSNVSANGQFAIGVIGDKALTDVRSAQRDSGSTLSVIDLQANTAVNISRFSGPFSLSTSTHGEPLLAARSATNLTSVEIWNLADKRQVGALIGHTDEVYAITFSPDGRRIATAGRDSLRLWDSQSFTEMVQLRGHSSFIWALAFSPDGSTLASGSGDNTVRLWIAESDIPADQ